MRSEPSEKCLESRAGTQKKSISRVQKCHKSYFGDCYHRRHGWITRLIEFLDDNLLYGHISRRRSARDT